MHDSVASVVRDKKGKPEVEVHGADEKSCICLDLSMTGRTKHLDEVGLTR